MKKQDQRKQLDRSLRPVADGDLRAIQGGSRDAYFVKVDRETTTP